jgi:hypothetical protein
MNLLPFIPTTSPLPISLPQLPSQARSPNILKRIIIGADKTARVRNAKAFD